MTDERRFDAIRARWLAQVAREETYRMGVLWEKYRERRPERSWMTRGEIAKLEQLRGAQDREGEKMFALLDRIGGRDWRSHAPYDWIMRELTFADATTTGELKTLPRASSRPCRRPATGATTAICAPLPQRGIDESRLT